MHITYLDTEPLAGLVRPEVGVLGRVALPFIGTVNFRCAEEGVEEVTRLIGIRLGVPSSGQIRRKYMKT